MSPNTIGSNTYMLQLYNAGAQCFICIGNGTSGNGPLNGMIVGNDGSNAYIHNREATTLKFGTSNLERMFISPSGNVGINNPTPAKKLEISSATNADGILLTGTGTAFPTGFSKNIEFSYTDTDTSYASAIKFEVKNSSEHGGQISFWTDAGPSSTTSQGTSARTMTIDRNQNVGIGIESPVRKFHVYNNANGFISRFTGGASGDVNIGMYGHSSSAFGSIGTESAHRFSLFTSGTDRLNILSNGLVGINCIPGYQLDVTGTIRATSDVIAFSDKRVKENIITIDNVSYQVGEQLTDDVGATALFNVYVFINTFEGTDASSFSAYSNNYYQLDWYNP